MKIQYIFFVFLIGLFSCADDEKAIIPAYLTINDVNVSTTAGQGTNSANITDVKVFINDKSLGTFELPASIPILQTGKNVNVKIRGGIYNNGQSTDRSDYPFYDFYSFDTTFTAESEYTINPIVKYFSTALINDPEVWAGEDFENAINFNYDDDSDTSFIRVLNSSDNFEGATGLAHLLPGQTYFEAYSPTFVKVSRGAQPTYVEFNYKSTHDIELAIYANGQSIRASIVFLKARGSYTKIYIPLKEVFSRFSTAINYNFVIAYSKPVDEEGRLFVDNFKMVRYE